MHQRKPECESEKQQYTFAVNETNETLHNLHNIHNICSGKNTKICNYEYYYTVL